MEYPAVADPELYLALYEEINKLLPKDRIHSGICWTSDVYYVSEQNNMLDIWTKANVKCVEMETSLLFVFASTRGLRAATILACDGNLHTGQKSEQETADEKSGEQDPLTIEAVDKEIKATVKAIDRQYAKHIFA